MIIRRFINNDKPKKALGMSPYAVRPYTDEDFPMIATWWQSSYDMVPNPHMMPKESTFILEIDNIPAYCLTAYLTNTLEMCYFENFIKNPSIKSNHKASNFLVDHMSKYVKSLGYKRAIAFADKDKLKARYKDFGFVETINVLGFVKELQ